MTDNHLSYFPCRDLCIYTSSSGQLALSGNAEGPPGLVSVLTRAKGSEPGTRESGKTENADDRQVQIVHWDGYQRIDREEVARGAMKGKPREKVVDVGQMLDIAGVVGDE